jgi:hypothetical protein
LFKKKLVEQKRLTSSLKEGKMIVSSIYFSVVAAAMRKMIKRENPMAEFLHIVVVAASDDSVD